MLNFLGDTSMLDCLDDPILVVEVKSETITYMNTACRSFLDIEENQAETQRLESILLDCSRFSTLLEELSAAYDQNQPYVCTDMRVRTSCCTFANCDINIGFASNARKDVYCIFQTRNDLISLRSFQDIVLDYPEPTFVMSMKEHMRVAFANHAFYQYFDCQADDFQRIFEGNFANTFEQRKKRDYSTQISEQLHKDNQFALEIEHYDSNGMLHHASLSGIMIQSQTDDQTIVYCHMHGIDEKQNLINTLSSEQQVLQAVQSLSSEILFRFRFAGGQMEYFGSARESLNLPSRCDNYPQCILEKNLVHPDDHDMFLHMIEQAKMGVEEPVDIRLLHPDGAWVWYRKEYIVQYDKQGKPMEAIGKVANIQSQKGMEERLNVDDLTGCLTKHAFMRLFEQLLITDYQAEHALLIIDLDNFKAVNDNLGHQFGDMVLREVGDKLRKIFRSTDYVGRIGGDEFMVCVRNVADLEVLQKKAQIVLEALDITYKGECHSYRISSSIGIARYPNHGYNYKQLYDNADVAMYEAKGHGKNRFAIYHDQLSMGTMENTLPYELASRSISQHFDPKIVSDTFHMLFETNDFDISINTVLKIIGTRFGASRTYIFECREDNPDMYYNSYEWCSAGIEPQIDALQELPQALLDDFFINANDEGILYCNDLQMLKNNQAREIMEMQGIQSFLHSYIRSSDKITYIIGFDECMASRIWSPIEISTLLYVSKIITQFLSHQKALKIIRQVSDERLSVMDSFNFYSYIVDCDSYQLSYFNKATADLLPELRIGDICYKALRGKDAPCTDCPLRIMRESEQARARMIIQNTYLGLQILVNASLLSSFHGKESMIVASHEINDLVQMGA